MPLKRIFLLILLAALLTLPGCLNGPQPNTQPPTEPAPTLPQSPFSPGDFTEDKGFLSCAGVNAVVGIDVSHHQQQIDWQQVADAGVKFAMIRLGRRGLTTGALAADDLAAVNLAGAREAGLKIGAYFYSQAVSPEEAAAEAAFALQILDGTPLDLPLVYDWELEDRTAGVDQKTLTACTRTFCEAVEAAGYTAMIYFNSYQALELLDLLQLTAYPWWLAMYDHTQNFPCRMDMWQYTNTGSVPGIQGNVDVNLLFPDTFFTEVFSP